MSHIVAFHAAAWWNDGLGRGATGEGRKIQKGCMPHSSVRPFIMPVGVVYIHTYIHIYAATCTNARSSPTRAKLVTTAIIVAQLQLRHSGREEAFVVTPFPSAACHAESIARTGTHTRTGGRSVKNPTNWWCGVCKRYIHASCQPVS